MRRPWLVGAMLLVFFSACATNPARVITPNDEEVQVLDGTVEVDVDGDGDVEKTDFIRGKTHLDEQEFYEAIGDTESYATVKGSRTAGTILQGLGFSAMVIGLIAVAGGLVSFFLSDTNDGTKVPIIPVPEEMRQYVLYGVYGSGGLAGLGGLLFVGMQPKTRGDVRLFALDHARKRLETSLYGENGATPDDIKTLTFGAGNERDALCAGGSLALGPLVARDARGRAMSVVQRSDWFEWKTTPREGLVVTAPDAPLLNSPVSGTNFADLDSSVTLSVQVASTAVGHAMTFEQSVACPASLVRQGGSGGSGGSGRPGKSGDRGSSSRAAASGAPGFDGDDGKHGNAGPDVVAEVSWVTTPKRGRIALLVVGTEARLFDPTKTKATVVAAGGRGGSGGSGGRGCHGGEGSMGDCERGASGGTGGRGGRGGVGGRGGRVVIRATDQTLLDAVEGFAPGGEGGEGGDAGGAGEGGSGSACHGKGAKGQIYADKGNRGSPGQGGQPGSPGDPGTVDEELVSSASLAALAKVVAANPNLVLDSASAPTARKRR